MSARKIEVCVCVFVCVYMYVCINLVCVYVCVRDANINIYGEREKGTL